MDRHAVPETEEERAQTLRRVRSLLKLSGQKSASAHETFKERNRKETEFFKKLFMELDDDGTGTLSLAEVIVLARKRLKITKRLVTDEQLADFFATIDRDGDGVITFSEFLLFVRHREKNTKFIEGVLTQVKRAVRLAMGRQNMSLAQLENKFYNSAEEGIVDSTAADGSLGPEEMRRFFRKVLDVNTHEVPDKNLIIAFKAMDEDGGGTLDAEEFMDFIRLAMQEETTLCPPCPKENKGGGCLLSGMGGTLPARLPKGRPGTTFYGGRSEIPFCFNGRDLVSTQRLSQNIPMMLRTMPSRPARSKAAVTATLLPTGLPKTAAIGYGALSRSHSAGFLGHSAHHSEGDDEDPEFRGCYTAVKGMLDAQDAAVLNRIEQRLCGAGVDVRGLYHQHG